MNSTLEFVRYYAMAGVYIAIAVFGISAVVALIEKLFGLNSEPRFHQLPAIRDTSRDL